MVDAVVVGKRLKKLRGELSMQTVADAVGISVSALGMYEIGQRIPRDEIKVKLARYFETTVEALFFTC